MARGNPFQRPSQTRVVGRKIIIACEGSKTERGYFEEIRKSMRLPTLHIFVVHPNATDPRSIVRAAIEYRRERKADKTWTTGDEAWAVFDGDEHILSNPANWNDALQIARDNKIRLAVSNPSFEFWYLLHYQDRGGKLSRQDALRLLRKHIENYEKANKLWPEPLQPLTADAVRRARQLARRAEADGLQPHANPCTSVCELVESLLALVEEVRR
jgi:hypothetical protein